MSDIDKADYFIGNIERNYPRWPSTFGICCADECSNSSRGSGLCSKCSENALAEIIGKKRARMMHEAISNVSDHWCFIRETLEEKELID